MPEETADPWREILREVIEENSDQPLIGARFRAKVNSAASKRALQLPPTGRFIKLLERYSDVVSVMRRPGQDFLVAPTGRSDLLANEIQERLYGIRRDLFVAFATVSSDRPHYDKTADRVVWQRAGEGQTLPDSTVPIEPTTTEAELQLRRDFAETVPEQSTSRSLLWAALTGPKPFQAFGKTVREAGLQRKWHSFRVERLVEKIQRWARDKEIEWKDGWLTEVRTYYAKKGQPFASGPPIRREGDPLQLLFSGLDAVDIQRISVPLDLVLKAISSSKKR